MTKENLRKRSVLQWFKSYLSCRFFGLSCRVSQHLATGLPQASVHGPLLFFICMSSLGSVIQKHAFSCHYLSFQPDDTTAAHISASLTDNSCWMKDHHLQLNLPKTEVLVVPAKPTLHYNFITTIQLGLSTITPSRTASCD